MCAVLLCLACKLELETISGTSVDYRYSPGLVPCAGNATYVDQFAVFAAGLLAVDRPAHVSFAWVPAEEFGVGRLRSCEGSLGCASKNEAYSQWPIHLHEVVHALLYSVNEAPLPFLEEGVATALDMSVYLTLDVLRVNSGGKDDGDPRPELTKDAHIDYAKAGLFTLYLIQRYGPEKFMTLYRRSKRAADLSAVRGLFLNVYDIELDEIVEAYLQDNDCPADIIHFPWYECTAPRLSPQDGAWLVERPVDCSEDDARGGIDSDLGVATSVTIEVTEPGSHTIEIVGPDIGMVHLAPCGGCRWLDRQVVVFTGDTETAFLPVGEYLVTARFFEASEADVRVSITPSP